MVNSFLSQMSDDVDEKMISKSTKRAEIDDDASDFVSVCLVECALAQYIFGYASKQAD